jgi:Arylsulfotransferase (ASST)
VDPASPAPRRPISRRRFLGFVGALAAAGASIGALELVRPGGPGRTAGASEAAATSGTPGGASPIPSATPDPHRTYRSRPDLAPPIVAVTTRDGDLAPGLIFLTPANGAGRDGPMVVDDSGELVWMHPEAGNSATDLRVASLRGAPVLTWWEGANNGGIGVGEHIVADTAYRVIARIPGSNGRSADLHELQLTAQGTALFLSDAETAPVLPVGSGPLPTSTLPSVSSPSVSSPGVSSPGAAAPVNPPVMDCAIQEVDLAAGRLLFEWHSANHIAQDESVVPVPTQSGVVYDYLHANSLDVDTDGGLIMSARNTSAIYKIDRQTGEVRWRLGGKRSDFVMGPGASFAFQHDARRQTDGTLTVFDDGQAPGHSRAIVLRLDESAMIASLVREYPQPQGLLATSQGNMQILPNGHVFVGWGSVPRFSEFDAGGRLVYDASFTSSQSYRDYRFPWDARPVDAPAIAIDATTGPLTVYASWNGATGVATWEVLAGSDAASLEVTASAARSGFETSIDARTSAPLVAVRARDASGTILGTSPTVSTAA